MSVPKFQLYISTVLPTHFKLTFNKFYSLLQFHLTVMVRRNTFSFIRARFINSIEFQFYTFGFQLRNHLHFEALSKSI